MAELRNRSRILMHLAALAAILVYFGWHAAGHAVPVGLAGPQADGLTQGLPKLHFFASELKAGRFPTWDPLAGAGEADYPVRSYLVYPTTLLTALLLPPWPAMLVDVAVAFLLMYWFAWLLLRRAEVPEAAAIAGALVVVFGGLNLRYIFYPYFSQTAAWIPLVFLAVEGLFQPGTRRRRMLLLGAGALGLMILAGMLNYVAYTFVFGGAWLLFLSWRGRKTKPGWWWNWATCVGMAVLGLALGAARLAPLVSQAGRMRGGYGDWEVFSQLLQTPTLLAVSLAPGAFADYKMRLSGVTLAYGLTTWSLALAWLALGRKKAIDWFWIAVLVVGLAASLRSPLTRLLFDLLPGYGSFEPSRIWSVCNLALVWLAVRAFRDLAAEDGSRRVLYLAAGLAVLFVIAFGLTAMRIKVDRLAQLIPMSLGLLALISLAVTHRRLAAERLVLLLALVLALEVFARAGCSSERIDLRRLYRSTPIIEALTAAEQPLRVMRLGDRWDWLRDGRLYTQEALKIDGIEDLHAYSSMIDPALRMLLDLYRGETDDRLNPFESGAAIQPFLTTTAVQNGLADRLGVGFVLAQRPIIEPVNLRPVAEHGGLTLYENPNAMPRAFFVTRGIPVADTAAALRMLQQGLDWRFEAVLTGPAPGISNPSTTTDRENQVRWLERTAARQKLLVNAPLPGFLVVTELYDRDWRATVDGRPAPIYPADVAFRAVPLPAGQSEVIFVYRPRALYLGAAISLAALALLLVLLLWPLSKARARASETNAVSASAAR